MGEPVEPIGGALDGVEELVCPKRGFRLVWKVVALIFTIMVAMTAVRFGSRLLIRTEEVGGSSVEATVHDQAWFVRKAEEVAALDAKIAATQQALERKQSEASGRWVSRESDRLEFDRLNHEIVALQATRAALVVDYNSASIANPALGIAPISTN